ncbi:hypothetical protein J7K92_02480 [bacterium]|nr:hypothetical protein [bacterium]
MKYSPTIIFLLFIADIIIIFVFGIPQYRGFSQAFWNFKVKKAEVENFQNNFQYLQEIKQKLTEKKEEVAKIDTILPDSHHSNQAQIVYFLEKTAKDNGCLISKLSVEAPKPFKQNVLEPSNQIPIYQRDLSIEMMASYKSFVNFLKQVEKSAIFIVPQSIQINTSSTEHILSINLKGRIFLYKK